MTQPETCTIIQGTTETLSSLLEWQEILTILQLRKAEIISEAYSEQSQFPCEHLSAEMVLQLNERKRRELFQVFAAIARIQRGKYGECEVCEDEIPRLFLQQFPYLRLCPSCQKRSRNLFESSLGKGVSSR
jgi:RNA polymerase-binding transcription factor DksA